MRSIGLLALHHRADQPVAPLSITHQSSRHISHVRRHVSHVTVTARHICHVSHVRHHVRVTSCQSRNSNVRRHITRHDTSVTSRQSRHSHVTTHQSRQSRHDTSVTSCQSRHNHVTVTSCQSRHVTSVTSCQSRHVTSVTSDVTSHVTAARRQGSSGQDDDRDATPPDTIPIRLYVCVCDRRDTPRSPVEWDCRYAKLCTQCKHSIAHRTGHQTALVSAGVSQDRVRQQTLDRR